MDINVVVINLGNSRIAVGAFVAGNLQFVQRVGADDRAAWTRVIEEAWSHVKGREGAAVAGASVNPPLVESLEHVVMQATGQSVQWAGKQLDLPIKVLTEQPEQTGVDRILGLAAAYEQMQKACCVVDAGSAVTINCCNENGDFVGGTIAPGAAMQLSALHQNTARLPRVVLTAPAGAIGKSTEEAIRAGVYHGIRGMVKEVVEAYATELGAWPDLIATGGDAAVLFADSEFVHAISPDLVLYGIALAYTEHHIKNRS